MSHVDRQEELATARRLMVERQLVPRGIVDRRVLDAMSAVPRHEFVPEEQRHAAYADHAMSIGLGQTISQPYIVAVMTQHLLGPRRGELQTVLEVGAGSGYQAAVLAHVAAHVITVERIPALAERARATLERLGYDRVEVAVGDGTLGLEGRGPFDGLLVAAAAPEIPRALAEQLAPGGRLVAPVGSRGLQELLVLLNTAAGHHTERHEQCVFVPLIGRHGWEG